METTWLAVLAAAGLIALLYSSVGHGGASGYLAVLALAGFAKPAITPVVLWLNLVVAGLAFHAYYRAGHFIPRLLAPFIVTSLPATVIGGMLHVGSRAYALILGAALVLSAGRFLFVPNPVSAPGPVDPRTIWRVGPPAGAALGLLAGLVGIGGGVFLSPLLLLLRWADAKQTGALSAAFIVINSLGGLAGHLARGAMFDWSLAAPLSAAVVIGGTVGSQVGATRLSRPALQRLLAVVLTAAGIKLIAGSG
jgi:uncharacterized membrane protein YfcA